MIRRNRHWTPKLSPELIAQSLLRARLSISVATLIRINALGSTTIVNEVRGRSLLPVIHALSLIPIAPVTSLSTISLLPHDLLLGPNSMTSSIIPSASSQVLGLNTLRLRFRSSEIKTKTETLDFTADADTDAVRSLLADFFSDELGGSADLGAGAVNVAGGFLPWGMLL
jgi:hypothetical protein